MTSRFRLLFIALLTNQFAASSLEAQVLSGFNYQGQLNNGGNPASGLFDLRFTIHDASTNGNVPASPLTNAPVSVSNGLFNAALDFGPGVFTGDPRWLEIGVRTNGDLAAYTTLQPRQRLGPVPYAIFAGGVSATGITGTISTANLGPGTITSNLLAAGAVGAAQLAPGAAAANLQAGGLGGVPSTGVLLAESDNATNLLNAGFLKIGEASIGEGWLWRAATNILGPRVGHSAVWTGTEMIIWGGEFYDGTYHYYNTGARYNPTTARWTTMSTSNAPIPRSTHVAVWTGTEMIVWGGIYVIAGDHYLNDGGRYNPATDTWTPITTTDAPGPRYNGRAVWSGSEMIVWGGTGPGIQSLADGGRYDPVSNFWSSVSSAGQPTARSVHSAIWTGTEMIVWGGIYYQGGNQRFKDGGRYHPGSNSWTAVSTAVAPDARTGHSAIWTGTEMIIWGGVSGGTTYDTGGRYHLASNTWTPITTTGAPSPRQNPTGVWSGKEMIIWGGVIDDANLTTFGDGARYDPGADRWTNLSANGTPPKRYAHVAVWTGNEMILFGGGGSGGYRGDTYSYGLPRSMYMYLRP